MIFVIRNNRFLLPIQQCEFTLTSILEQLQRDPWSVDNDKRPRRCTGVAMSVGIGLMEVRYYILFSEYIYLFTKADKWDDFVNRALIQTQDVA